MSEVDIAAAPLGRADSIEGALKAVKSGGVSGWAWNPSAPSQRVDVDVYVDGEHIVTIRAERLRPDLVDAGIGDGTYGFKFNFGGRFDDGKKHLISVRPAGQPIELEDSPRSCVIGGAGSAKRTPAPANDPAPRNADSFQSSDAARGLIAAALSPSAPLPSADVIKTVLSRSPLDAVRADCRPDDIATRLSARKRSPTGSAQLWLDVSGAESEAVEATLASWALLGFGARPVLLGQVEDAPSWLGDLGLTAIEPGRWEAPPPGLVLFAVAGDTFHPDLGDILAAAPASACGAVWDIGLQTGAGARAVLRRPCVLGLSSVGGGLGRSGFALNSRYLKPESTGRSHPAVVGQVRAGAAQGSGWFYLPAPLSSARAGGRRDVSADELSEAMAVGAPGFRLLSTAPTVIVAPAPLDQTVGVVLLAKPGQDLKGALSGLAKQQLPGPLGICVVMAADEHRGQARARATAEKLLQGADLQFVAASGQGSEALDWNGGAAALTSDVLLFLSADFKFNSPLALQAMAAWAGQDGVGAVTCRAVVEGVPSAPIGLENSLGVRPSLSADRFYGFAISRRAWRLAGEFKADSFPQLYDVEWKLRADRAGLCNVHLNDVAMRAVRRAPLGVDGVERLLLKAMYPAKGFGEALGAVDDLADSQRSDERAVFLAGRLLEARREAGHARQDALKEIAELRLLAGDVLTAVDSLGYKLERS